MLLYLLFFWKHRLWLTCTYERGLKHQQRFIFSTALFFHGRHSVTWHEGNLTWERGERERADETSSTDEIFTAEEVHSWSEMLPCLLSVLFFLTRYRGTCFPLCRPIYAISEGEAITQGWGGMFFILFSLPARLLQIQLLSGQLKDGACWGSPVWHRPKRGMPQREEWSFDPYLFTISIIKPHCFCWKHFPTLLELLSLKILLLSVKQDRISLQKQSTHSQNNNTAVL